MQKIFIAGRIGNCTTNLLEGKNKVAINFSVAVDDSYVDTTTGEVVEQTNWYNCALYRETGKDKLAEYLKPGTHVTVIGKPGIDTYVSKTNEIKAGFKITVSELDLQGSPKEKEDAPAEQQVPEPATA